MLHKIDKSPDGVYPALQPKEQIVPSADEDGQLPALRGAVGVGCEHLTPEVSKEQKPVALLKTPLLHVIERDPLAI